MCTAGEQQAAASGVPEGSDTQHHISPNPSPGSGELRIRTLINSKYSQSNASLDLSKSDVTASELRYVCNWLAPQAVVPATNDATNDDHPSNPCSTEPADRNCLSMDESLLKPTPKLRLLILSGNRLTDGSVEDIATLISQLSHIEVLNLSSNLFTANACKALMTAALTSSSLTTITLRANPGTAKLQGLYTSAAVAQADQALQGHLCANLKRARGRQKSEQSRKWALKEKLAREQKQAHKNGTTCLQRAHIAVLGGGIGGAALALALTQRGIRCTVFERDAAFDVRRQGYGLTLQQGSRSLRMLGLESQVVAAGSRSTSHFVFNHSGGLLAFWGPGTSLTGAPGRGPRHRRSLSHDDGIDFGRSPSAPSTTEPPPPPSHQHSASSTPPGVVDEPLKWKVPRRVKSAHRGIVNHGAGAEAEAGAGAGVETGAAWEGSDRPQAANSMRSEQGEDACIRGNLHIPRQALRQILLDALPPGVLQWGAHCTGHFTARGRQPAPAPAPSQPGRGEDRQQNRPPGEHPKGQAGGQDGGLVIYFKPAPAPARSPSSSESCSSPTPSSSSASPPPPVPATFETSAVVGCDGIFSMARTFLAEDSLNSLGHFVMLGLFDASPYPLCGARVFQTSDGETRIFVMPYKTKPPALRASPSPSPAAPPCTSDSATAAAAVPATGISAATPSAAAAATVPATGISPSADPDACGRTHAGAGTTPETTPMGGNARSSGSSDFSSALPGALASSSNVYMWQLSWPLGDEAACKQLARAGPHVLKAEALRRCGHWHHPLGDILHSTPVEVITGYPVYDRDPPISQHTPAGGAATSGSSASRAPTWRHTGPAGVSPAEREGVPAQAQSTAAERKLVTLCGDAAHPMSPFKGQGANQALSDASMLAECLYRHLSDAPRSSWSSDYPELSQMVVPNYAAGELEAGVSEMDQRIWRAFEAYELEMATRSTRKVLQSREAVKLLHQPGFLDPAFHVSRKPGICGEEMMERIAAMQELRPRDGDAPVAA